MTPDYIIIGAGSAGCAMAYRLSENGKHKVLVLEYGGSDRGPLIQMPAALSYPMNMQSYDWGYETEAEPHLGGRKLACPRGKVIGGSSSINGMVYVRGHACDYDHWESQGAEGWGYRHVLPYFKRMEHWHSGGHGGDPSWRGNDGPLHINRGSRKNPLFQAFVEAGREAGYPVTSDYNGQQQEGFSPMEMTTHQGSRWSAAKAYLRPALKRPNVQLIKCRVLRIIFDHSENIPKAIGVEIKRGNLIEKIYCNQEVIISSSSINSPCILKHSGIGPAAELQSFDIPVIADRQGVGENLQDHLELYIQQECLQPITLYKHLNLFSKAMIGAQWLFFKSGHGTTNHFESAAFIRSKAGVKYPDIQYHFLPVAIRYDGKSPAKSHGFQAHVGPMRSNSRGFVRLKSPDPSHAPKIQFNYMSTPEDWENFRTSIRLTREIFTQPAFKDYAGHEISPGDDIQNDEALDDYISSAVESAYHPCGTCKMGAEDDPMAVVDKECRVIGVRNLRLADSSIFPRITNGNLNGPSIMVGEKASDHILEKTPLPAANDRPWINPNWETSQR